MKKLSNRMKLIIGASAFVTLVAAMTPAIRAAEGIANGERERHPHIHIAVRELRAAIEELKTADHDFGGHRERAVEASQRAVEQLEKALEFDRK